MMWLSDDDAIVPALTIAIGQSVPPLPQLATPREPDAIRFACYCFKPITVW